MREHKTKLAGYEMQIPLWLKSRKKLRENDRPCFNFAL
jgi:hypothetical protein